MIYEANYENGAKTITQDFSEIVAFVRDMKISAVVNVWENGNCIMNFDVRTQRI